MTNGDSVLWCRTAKDNICSGADAVGLLAQGGIILATLARMIVRMSFTPHRMTFCQGQLTGWITMSGLTLLDMREVNKINNILFHLWLNYYRCLSVTNLYPLQIFIAFLFYSIRVRFCVLYCRFCVLYFLWVRVFIRDQQYKAVVGSRSHTRDICQKHCCF